MAGVTHIQQYGNQMTIIYDDGSRQLAYPTPGGLWLPKRAPVVVPPDPTGDLIDNLEPGHGFAEGTLEADWQWHLDNNGGPHGRGGNDLNYAYGTDFYAPGAGTISHFDVSGVGMVVKLILDVPAVRTQPAFENDYPGPMQAIWFQHCSDSAADGHYNQGDYIGKSGDGYGDYPAHLHVHGREDTTDSSSGDGRTCFWHFI